jgi:hypothetical protein
MEAAGAEPLVVSYSPWSGSALTPDEARAAAAATLRIETLTTNLWRKLLGVPAVAEPLRCQKLRRESLEKGAWLFGPPAPVSMKLCGSVIATGRTRDRWGIGRSERPQPGTVGTRDPSVLPCNVVAWILGADVSSHSVVNGRR